MEPTIPNRDERATHSLVQVTTVIVIITLIVLLSLAIRKLLLDMWAPSLQYEPE